MSDRQPVIVHVLKEESGARAAKILGVSETYDGGPTVRGVAGDEQIHRLEKAGLIVEIDEPSGPIEDMDRALYRASVRYDWRSTKSGGLIPYLDGHVVPGRRRSRGGTFTTVPTEAGIDLARIIEEAGGTITRALPGGVMITRLGSGGRQALEEDPRVEIDIFNRSPALAPGIELGYSEALQVSPETGEPREFDLIAHAPDRVREIEAWVERNRDGLERLGASATKVRIRIEDTSPLLDQANLLDAVFDIAPVPVARLCLDRVPAMTGVASQSVVASRIPLDGAGQVIAMTDGAVALSHGDFADRVTQLSGPTAPVSAHGTHVAGIIAGDGTLSNGQILGIAPGAQLLTQAIAVGTTGGLSLPLDLNDLLEESYAAGARIHNLSFAETNARSLYSQRANELDAFAVAHPDMLIVVAAGNDAESERNQWRPDGEPDLLSIASPGIAKNVLTVGASCSDRSSGGLGAARWSEFPPPGRYASLPTAGSSISGNASDMSAFSGRGWGHDLGRIKPDLVAPGTNIIAARARDANDDLWGRHSDNYVFGGGTSSAAPIVSACAALVRQHYVAQDHDTPSAALLRATLIAGADWLGGSGACHADPAPPAAPTTLCANVDQGFGRVNVARALGLDGSGRTLCYVDVPANGPSAGTVSNGLPAAFERDDEYCRFWFDCLPGSAPIDIALCFTDPVPGPSGVSLGLFLEDDGGTSRVGNDTALKPAYPRRGRAPDRQNNVQVIRFTPASRTITVQITALALIQRRVGFALVVVGGVKNSILHRF